MQVINVGGLYATRKGDSLGGLATRFMTSTASLAAANPVSLRHCLTGNDFHFLSLSLSLSIHAA